MRYYATGLPWGSGLGTDVSHCKTSREVMEAAGLDFIVDKCELVAKMPFNIKGNPSLNDINSFSRNGYIYKDVPNGFATYRSDIDVPLGIVKSKYEVVQNIDAFDFFDAAIGEGKAIWNRAGCFGLGHKIFVTAKLPVETTVNGDKIDNYLIFSNSHDGSMSINIMFAPVRVICTNMLNSARESASSYIRLRHTKTVKERLSQGAEVLRIACEHAKSAQQLYQALTTIKMTDDAVMRYLADLQLTDAEREALLSYDKQSGYKRLLARDYRIMEVTGVSTRKANQIVNMFEYYLDGIGQKEIAGTAWGAYNAVTGFYSNVANLEGEKRMDSLCYGNANRNMNKALNAAYAEAV